MNRSILRFVSLRYNFELSICFASLLCALASCSPKQNKQASDSGGFVVEAIEGDVDSFNPLFAQDVTAGEINDLLYPGLMSAKFDASTGLLDYQPLAAKSWEFENGNADIRFHLRAGARWADGEPFTARDIQMSFELYGDTTVGSVRQTSLDGLRRTPTGSLDVKQAVEIIDDTTIVFHFDHPYPGQLFDAGLPILPAHIFGKIPREHLREDSASHHPVSLGPFRLESWKPLQEIVLGTNQASTVLHPALLSQLIFRVLPDYHSRVMQLRSGEIDIFPFVNPEDAVDLAKNNPQLEIVPLGERFYDAINWNNIDGHEFITSKGKKVRPHPLFGSAKVRRALTMAIDRKELVESLLGPYGREAVGPVSPLFRWAYNDSLRPLPFDPKSSEALLSGEGWKDTDGDDILDKRGRKFAFVLKIPSGNKMRSTIASIVQNQLRALKIEVKIEQLERPVFWGDLMEKKFDACIAGFNVPLQMQLEELWGSELDRSPFNLASFRNPRVAEILAGAKRVRKESDHAAAWKEFQAILQEEQPCTFLYWMNDLVAINKRVQGTSIGVRGIAYEAGEWHVVPAPARASIIPR